MEWGGGGRGGETEKLALVEVAFTNCYYFALCFACKLVFYAQSTSAVISGRYTSHIVYLIFNNVYVLKWVYIQF